VFAQWVVPEIIDYHVADQDLNVAFWVGLDGFGNDQILQAGIGANLRGDDVSYYAWTEWWTREFQDPAVWVTNFPITAGTTVAVLICAPEPDYGAVSILNLSTQVGTHVGVPARPNITLSGASAEWVVESPTPALPYFYPMIFHNCMAGTQHGLFQLMPDGIVTEITASIPNIDAPGPPITQTSICGASTAVVEWEGFGEQF
jgi:Peptidase A4 family